MAFDDYRRRGGIFLWTFQRLSAVILLAMLLGHFYFLHSFRQGFITYEKIAPRLASAEWKIFEVAFLIVAVSHGFNGLWTLVLEYVHDEPKQKVLRILLVLVGLLFLGIGVTSVVSFSVKP